MRPLPLVTPENKRLYWAFGLVAGSWLICLLISAVLYVVHQRELAKIVPQPTEKLQQFSSETEFRTYFQDQQQNNMTRMVGDVMLSPSTVGKGMAMPAEIANYESTVPAPERVSETNVQVKGIDEPDIVKTDGTHIYIGGESYRYYAKPVRAMESSIMPMPPMQEVNKNQIIQALPVETMKTVGTFDVQGDLLLTDEQLVVIGSRKIVGVDVKNPAAPKEIWSYSLSNNQSVTTARLVDGTIVLVTESRVYTSIPCPIPLFGEGGKEMAIRCTDVWRPTSTISVDSTYTVLQLNPKDGMVQHQVSFVGSASQTVIYVSPTTVYVSFTKSANWSKLTVDFLMDDSDKLITPEVKEHLQRVMTLDISDAAKQVEVDTILAKYTANMSDDDRLQWETERNNLMTEYVDLHKRELEQTYIAKIPLADFSVAALGEVPGRPLNQFSLDEYQDTFRIATTVGGRSVGGGAKSANDVYVLDSGMKVVGSVTDLGKEERIYAVRFMGKSGYVVTFKETDPLYVLDLSNAAAPKVVGELKIPGYSSYLHPLTDTLLVGIGKEDSQVKVSLFDVANPAQPTEVSKYMLTDYWSQIISTHHAFLQDAKHHLFFLPGDKGGYIFGYEDNALKLLKTVEGNGIKRALYINDNLYLIADNKITVVSETDWKIVNTLEW